MAKSFLVLFIAVDICLAFSTVFENFTEGICETGENELRLWDVSPLACLDECRARASCKSINVHTGTRMCEINEGSCSVSSEVGFLYSEKSQWTKMDLYDECKGADCAPHEICTLNRQTGKTQCTVKECSKSNIANGVILGTERVVGSKIYHKCDAGYKLEGSRTRTCLQSGEWSESLTKCVLLKCQTGWDLFQSNCYLFDNGQKMNFSDSVIHCESLGATMLHVATMDENKYVVDHLANGQKLGYWTGLTDVDLEDTWTWYSTGEISVVSYWNTKEPDGGREENCAVYIKGTDNKWADVDCSRLFCLICMMPLY